MAPADHPAGKWRVPLIVLRSLQVAISAISCALGVLLLLAAAAVAEYRGLIGFAVIYVLFAGASLVCSSIFLSYTVSPRARAASCGGNCGSCQRWGCDLGWDCFWAVLWAAETGLAIYTAVRARRGRAWADVAVSFGMFVLYVATAVMVGKVREAVKWRASEDIEAAKGGVGVVGPYTTAPPAVRV